MTQDLYAVGARVDGLYDGNSDDMWYPGHIQRIHAEENPADATYEVLYDDGEVEIHVTPQYLRKHVAGTICIGSRVFGRYAGGDEWYPGKVTEVQENGCYTIEYDDTEVEQDVPIEFIKESIQEIDGGDEDGAAEAAEEAPMGIDNDAQADTPADRLMDSGDAPVSVEPSLAKEQPVDVARVREPAPSAHNDNVVLPSFSDNPVALPVHRESPLSAAEQQPPLERPRYHPQQRPAYASPPHQQQSVASSFSPSEPDEYASIIESVEMLGKRLADATSIKAILSTLVKQMRAYPQVTADLVHERDGERLVIEVLRFHGSHAVIQCYCFVFLRRLCFLCAKSTHYFLRNGIIEFVTMAMKKFAEDAILQASACGALAVFTRVHAGLSMLLEHRVAQLVLATIVYHKTYSIHTRQVHYYACEVLLELCELGDQATLDTLCGDQVDEGLSDVSPISLLMFLLRQGLSFDDKKACCAVGTLLMWLAANNRYAAGSILRLNGLQELSTVMAKYPSEPGIQKYSASASKEIALSSIQHTSPGKRVKEMATEILQESSSFEDQERFHQANGARYADDFKNSRAPTNGRSHIPTSGKRKAGPVSSYLSPTRGASSMSYKDPLSFSKFASPIGKAPYLPTNMHSFSPSYPSSSSMMPAQARSSLVILDGANGSERVYASSSHPGERKQFAKEERESLLFETYGVQGIVKEAPGMKTQGIKRKQLKTHLVQASDSTWATPVVSPKQLERDELLAGPSCRQSYSSRSDIASFGSYGANPARNFTSSGGMGENGYDEMEITEHQYLYKPQQRTEPSSSTTRVPLKKKNKRLTSTYRETFQIKIESDTQLHISKEIRSPFASPISPSQKRSKGLANAARNPSKVGTRHAQSNVKRSTLKKPATSEVTAESLTAYAAKLFNEDFGFEDSNPGGVSTGMTNGLSAREKAEIQEKERLSFAEKLHKMIDKAKSSLAVSNVTSEPAVSSRSSKSSSSKASVRSKTMARPTVAETTAPAERKSRIMPSGVTKKAAKEISESMGASSSHLSALSQPKVQSHDAKQQVGSKATLSTPKKTVTSASTVASKSSNPSHPPIPLTNIGTKVDTTRPSKVPKPASASSKTAKPPVSTLQQVSQETKSINPEIIPGSIVTAHSEASEHIDPRDSQTNRTPSKVDRIESSDLGEADASSPTFSEPVQNDIEPASGTSSLLELSTSGSTAVSFGVPSQSTEPAESEMNEASDAHESALVKEAAASCSEPDIVLAPSAVADVEPVAVELKPAVEESEGPSVAVNALDDIEGNVPAHPEVSVDTASEEESAAQVPASATQADSDDKQIVPADTIEEPEVPQTDPADVESTKNDDATAADDIYADEYNDFDDDAGGDEANEPADLPDEMNTDQDASTEKGSLDELLSLADQVDTITSEEAVESEEVSTIAANDEVIPSDVQDGTGDPDSTLISSKSGDDRYVEEANAELEDDSQKLDPLLPDVDSQLLAIYPVNDAADLGNLETNVDPVDPSTELGAEEQCSLHIDTTLDDEAAASEATDANEVSKEAYEQDTRGVLIDAAADQEPPESTEEVPDVDSEAATADTSSEDDILEGKAELLDSGKEAELLLDEGDAPVASTDEEIQADEVSDVDREGSEAAQANASSEGEVVDSRKQVEMLPDEADAITSSSAEVQATDDISPQADDAEGEHLPNATESTSLVLDTVEIPDERPASREVDSYADDGFDFEPEEDEVVVPTTEDNALTPTSTPELESSVAESVPLVDTDGAALTPTVTLEVETLVRENANTAVEVEYAALAPTIMPEVEPEATESVPFVDTEGDAATPSVSSEVESPAEDEGGPPEPAIAFENDDAADQIEDQHRRDAVEEKTSLVEGAPTSVEQTETAEEDRGSDAVSGDSDNLSDTPGHHTASDSTKETTDVAADANEIRANESISAEIEHEEAPTGVAVNETKDVTPELDEENEYGDDYGDVDFEDPQEEVGDLSKPVDVDDLTGVKAESSEKGGESAASEEDAVPDENVPTDDTTEPSEVVPDAQNLAPDTESELQQSIGSDEGDNSAPLPYEATAFEDGTPADTVQEPIESLPDANENAKLLAELNSEETISTSPTEAAETGLNELPSTQMEDAATAVDGAVDSGTVADDASSLSQGELAGTEQEREQTEAKLPEDDSTDAPADACAAGDSSEVLNFEKRMPDEAEDTIMETPSDAPGADYKLDDDGTEHPQVLPELAVDEAAEDYSLSTEFENVESNAASPEPIEDTAKDMTQEPLQEEIRSYFTESDLLATAKDGEMTSSPAAVNSQLDATVIGVDQASDLAARDPEQSLSIETKYLDDVEGILDATKGAGDEEVSEPSNVGNPNQSDAPDDSDKTDQADENKVAGDTEEQSQNVEQEPTEQFTDEDSNAAGGGVIALDEQLAQDMTEGDETYTCGDDELVTNQDTQNEIAPECALENDPSVAAESTSETAREIPDTASVEGDYDDYGDFEDDKGSPDKGPEPEADEVPPTTEVSGTPRDVAEAESVNEQPDLELPQQYDDIESSTTEASKDQAVSAEDDKSEAGVEPEAMLPVNSDEDNNFQEAPAVENAENVPETDAMGENLVDDAGAAAEPENVLSATLDETSNLNEASADESASSVPESDGGEEYPTDEVTDDIAVVVEDTDAAMPNDTAAEIGDDRVSDMNPEMESDPVSHNSSAAPMNEDDDAAIVETEGGNADLDVDGSETLETIQEVAIITTSDNDFAAAADDPESVESSANDSEQLAAVEDDGAVINTNEEEVSSEPSESVHTETVEVSPASDDVGREETDMDTATSDTGNDMTMPTESEVTESHDANEPDQPAEVEPIQVAEIGSDDTKAKTDFPDMDMVQEALSPVLDAASSPKADSETSPDEQEPEGADVPVNNELPVLSEQEDALHEGETGRTEDTDAVEVEVSAGVEPKPANTDSIVDDELVTPLQLETESEGATQVAEKLEEADMYDDFEADGEADENMTPQGAPDAYEHKEPEVSSEAVTNEDALPVSEATEDLSAPDSTHSSTDDDGADMVYPEAADDFEAEPYYTEATPAEESPVLELEEVKSESAQVDHMDDFEAEADAVLTQIVSDAPLSPDVEDAYDDFEPDTDPLNVQAPTAALGSPRVAPELGSESPGFDVYDDFEGDKASPPLTSRAKDGPIAATGVAVADPVVAPAAQEEAAIVDDEYNDETEYNEFEDGQDVGKPSPSDTPTIRSQESTPREIEDDDEKLVAPLPALAQPLSQDAAADEEELGDYNDDDYAAEEDFEEDDKLTTNPNTESATSSPAKEKAKPMPVQDDAETDYDAEYDDFEE